MEQRAHFELRIWKEAHALTLEVYAATSAFPSHERFGLTGQLRRAAASVGANIAEGTGRATMKDFANFLHMARGSAHEVMNHLALARDLAYLAPDNARCLLQRYGGLAAGIYACITAVKKRG